MTTLTSPAMAFNFMVTMWDVQGPGLFGVDSGRAGGWGAAGRIASGAVNAVSQLLIGAFSEVSGLTVELEIESYAAGGENAAPKRFIKAGKYPNLTFKRGVTLNSELWDWHHQVVSGSDPAIRKSGIILVLDRPLDGGAGVRPPVAVWSFERALPERLIGPTLDAKTGALAIESLELCHEGLTRVPVGAIAGIAQAAAGVSAVLGATASLGGS